MSNYSPILAYGPKDTLPHGDPNKALRGIQLDAELQAIATAISSKIDGPAGGGTSAAGTYTGTFQSGSVQVCGPGNVFNGFGDFQFGRLLPNASGTPCVGLLLGGAGQTQVAFITDEQIPGQKGINVIREAGDATSVLPANNDGGDLLDFAGGTLNGNGGQAKYQGGTSVHGRAGDAVLHGGNSTNGTTGNSVILPGETGGTGGSTLIFMTKPVGSSAFGSIDLKSGNGALPGGSTVTLIQFLSNGEIYLTASGTGAGLAGQPLVSGGIGSPAKYQVGFTGSRTIGPSVYTWASGILMSVVP